MKKKTLITLLLPLALTSCGSKIPLEYREFVDFVEKKETRVDVDKDNYYQRKEDKVVELPYTSYGLNEIDELSDILSSRDKKMILSSEGDIKLLVVPVSFMNESAEYSSNKEEKRILIQNAFFGDNSVNSYESVASYYNKSSYGHVKLSGTVTNWYTCPFTIEEALKKAKTSSRVENVTKEIACGALEWLKNESNIDLSIYDTNNDEVIDAVYFVYDYPQDYGENGSRSSLLWAYYDYVPKNYDGGELNNKAPYIYSYSWSSFYFTGKNALKKHVVEANTYIHETGHMFGLDDYYNTNEKVSSGSGYIKNLSGIYQPTGFMDMMDYNLGDHNSFSKYLLKWVSPKVITKPGTITLNSFSETGDCILIPSPSWNGSPYDEYLLLEYFSPEGLNNSYNFPSYSYYDGDNNPRVFTYPNKHGLRVYHVDARVGYFGNITINSDKHWIHAPDIDEWANDPTHKGSRYLDFLNTNTTLGSVDETTPVFLKLLEASGKNNFYNGIAASNETLFGLRDSFGYDLFKDFKFNKLNSNNENEVPEFKFKITGINTKKITIEFENK